ncbi:hypothetical protein [Methylobacter sp.]|uniref:hypothetical protein n=1 Tax=Methylobacter sp. TaxID=2051955 RepID=UPI0011F6DCEA|nr:hypothetical protein [Methylobacter sp.]TAK60539.1 MAG: hypothetical protein EPO18_16935 [Methylobacter sp.]
MARWTNVLENQSQTNIYFDEPTNACWFATVDGDIQQFRVLGQKFRRFGSGWQDAVAVLPSTDGLHLFLVVSYGDILVVKREDGDRIQASVLLSTGVTVVAATRLLNNDLLVLDDAGQVYRVVFSARTSDLFTTVAGAKMLTADEASGELLLCVPDLTSQVYRFSLNDGSSVSEPFDVAANVVALCVPPPGKNGVVVCDDIGNVFLEDWSGAVDPFTFNIPDGRSLSCWHSLVIAAASSSLTLIEWGQDVELLPVSAGPDPLVPAGWAPIFVDYASAGLNHEDVEWSVDEGPLAATISVARPVSGKFEHRIIAGIGTPEFHITARLRSTASVVATRQFRVVRVWPDTEVGPPLATMGPQRVYARGAKWGGGPVGPQNISTHPAPENLRIAVAVFRLRDSKSSVNGLQRVADLTADVDGPGQSVRRYYEEVSYRATPVSSNPAHPKGTTVTLLGGSAFGPIDIDYAWGDLFKPTNPKKPWAPWYPKADTWDILGGEFSSFLIRQSLVEVVTKKSDSFVLTVLPGTDGPYAVGDKEWPAQWTWGFAGDSQIYWKGKSSATFKRIASVVLPAALPMRHPEPWPADGFMTAIAHELGHSLGLPDLYGGVGNLAELTDRFMYNWDLMANDVPLPHFSLPNRMQLGWIHPDWIEVCDFGQNPAGRTVSLQAMETLTRSGPLAGRKAGIEVRIREGWNYYFEFRQIQAGAIGDQKLNPSNVIVGTDLYTAPSDKALLEFEGVPGVRPPILLLPMDVDDDGPLLNKVNQDYKESDVTNPDRMNDFTLTRKGNAIFGEADPNTVEVQIDYQGAYRPELQIRPALGNGDFKSPDINLDGPAGPNVAVKGKTNTIKIKVHNRGSKAADSVQVKVQWLPFTTAPGPWMPLTTPPVQAIPAHDVREFIVQWTLPPSVQVGGIEAEHFCVRADVDRYIDPKDPAGSEIVVYNNWAQSNFSTDATGHGSPSERKSTAVSATNLLRVRVMHRTLIEQTSEYFRTYVDHAWRRLGPRQTDVTQVSYESLAGDPLHDRDFQIAFREAQDRGLVNDLTARTFVMPERVFCGPQERWGVQLQVHAGLRTFVREISARGELVSGLILAGDDARPEVVTGGNVRLVGYPIRRPEEQIMTDGQVDAIGEFRLIIPSELLWDASRETVMVTVFYHGTARFIPCRSREVPLRAG